MPRGGQNKFQPSEADRNTVKTMAAAGFKHENIARCLGEKGISIKTMYKHFRQELDTSADMANAVIANQAYSAAARGEAWAVCFWLKCRAKWRETHAIEHSGPDGTPIDVNVTPTEQLHSRVAGLIARSEETPGA
jgi:hypothetical protein